MNRLPGSRRLEQSWYDDSFVGLALQPFAWLYAAVLALRRLCYARGWLKSGHPGIPVIVVGNITVGGTGKTPLVAWLARRLSAEGRRPAIVSRGYGGKVGRQPVRVTAETPAEAVGDEPRLLARLTGLPVVVCADRARAARVAAAAGSDVIISDDGLQHLALARDLEIVVIDGSRRFGNGRLLPAGPLREPSSRLATVDLVAVNGGEPPPGGVRFTLRLGYAIGLNSGERRPVSSFAGQKAWAVAGIGNPARFLAGLRDAGIEAIAVDVPDHGRVDLASLRHEREWPILMTEKDAVKYPYCTDPAVWQLPAEFVISPDDEAVILSRVREVLREPRARRGDARD